MRKLISKIKGLKESKTSLHSMVWALTTTYLFCLVTSLVMTWKTQEQITFHEYWLDHSYTVSGEVYRANLTFNELEIGARGYSRSKRPVYLNQYLDSQEKIINELQILSKSIGDNKPQLDRVEELKGLIAQRVKAFDSAIYLAPDIAAKMVTSDEFFSFYVVLKSKFDDLRNQELKLLDKRKIDFQQAQRDRLIFFIILAGLNLALFIVFNIVLRLYIKKQERDKYLLEQNEILNREVELKTLQLTEINKELESFSYSVSHDLRAPLRAIEGFCSILKEDYKDSLPDAATGLINVIIENSQRMSRLIDDLLQFSRVGRRDIRKSEGSLDKIVTMALDDIKSEYPDDYFKYHIVKENLGNAMIDTAIFKQVYYNLLSNAFKFSSKAEHPEINIGYHTETDGKKVYYVRDNGVGFNMKYYEKLFGIFHRLHSDTDFKGTGVGLSITKRIIDKHGGKIWAESDGEHGATFYFTLE